MKLPIGVVGVSYGRRAHLPVFKAGDDFEVVAVASGRRERAEQVAREFDIPTVAEDWQALVRLPEIAAVSVVVPQTMHATVTLAALAAGKHVLCEKPMAMDEREAFEMYAAARARNLVTMVDLEYRFIPCRRWFKELVADGFLGELYGFSSVRPTDRYADPNDPTMSWRFEKDQGGGWLGPAGAHILDAIRWWFGEFASVSATLETYRPERLLPGGAGYARVDADDTSAVAFRLANGAMGVILQSCAAAGVPHAEPEIMAFGSRGSLTIDREGRVMGGRAGERALVVLPIPDRLIGDYDESGDRNPSLFKGLARDFARGIRSGVSPSPNFYDGWRNQQLIDAIRRAADERTWIDIPPGEPG
jgi:predicted dehydrogenase